MTEPATGQRPLQRLASAFHDCVEPPGRERRTAALASALHDCLNEAADKAAQRVKDELLPRLDKQDETLRLIWRQNGGAKDQHLPIDD